LILPLLWIELEIAHYKSAMRREILALKGVKQAPALHAFLPGIGVGAEALAGPRDGKVSGTFSRNVAV